MNERHFSTKHILRKSFDKYRSSLSLPLHSDELKNLWIFNGSWEEKFFLFFLSLSMPLSGLFVCFQTAGGIKIIFMGLSLFTSCEKDVKEEKKSLDIHFFLASNLQRNFFILKLSLDLHVSLRMVYPVTTLIQRLVKCFKCLLLFHRRRKSLKLRDSWFCLELSPFSLP